MTSAADLEATAALWLSRREDEGWGEADQRALDAWLEASVDHKMAFWRMEFGWRQAGRMAALKAAPPATSPPRPRLEAWRPALMAAGIAAVALIAVPLLLQSPMGASRYVTEVGGRATVPLRDGTRVELNTATRLRAEVGAKERTVWLDRGEAYFDVAHDAARPFVVHAGDRKVTVLGTRFSIRREGDRVEIVVAEGRVRVEAAGGAATGAPAVLLRGDRLVADGASTLRPPRSVEQVSEDLAWRDGLLSFEQTPLDEAAREFNRYNSTRLVVTGAAASEIRIDGRFEAANVEAFARLMQRGYGLKVARTDQTITISE
ncbi:MAG: FecR domain-containing protein [Caulobacter sp.]|nr:FecR domain-containing protein [Caulobacter sp.]